VGRRRQSLSQLSPDLCPALSPALVALVVLPFLSGWNQFLEPLIYLDSVSNYTDPLALTVFQRQYCGSYYCCIIMGGALIGTLPSIVVYLIGPRPFVQGINLRGVKR
jgi:multiple sugar transport system permease protein